jgi:hypothetical protein
VPGISDGDPPAGQSAPGALNSEDRENMMIPFGIEPYNR